MDTKRKANGTASVEADDRSSKRRKLSDFDLSKGETRESTTAYGLTFLDQIRRTADKNGRLVATYFEKLIPREGNVDYYRRTKMPISLEDIERKLNDEEFSNLAELESYFKRMITNAKDFYPRSSSTYDDAERVRKAVSNYMTKTNPAYQRPKYQALPTPLPPDDGEDADENEQDAEDEEQEEEGADDTKVEENGEGEDKDVEEEDAGADEEAEESGSRRRSIVLKRRGPGRPTRHSSSYAQESPKPSATPSRPDHQYEDVPYQGLSFQQAQEKIVEELLRHREPEYDDAYFEPFVNLPPRALKDYYKIVTDPLSLKKLQKTVKGVHGRNDASGVSDFKSWSAFEEKSKLLWTNAFYYNEEGSEIYSLAQDLQKAFYAQLKQAQAAVPEPAQPPKIKLKVGQSAEPPTSSKKISIHVGGRGGSVDSPAPQTAESSDSPVHGQNVNGTNRSSGPLPNLPQLEKARSASASAASPSPSLPVSTKAEDSVRMSPANLPRPPSATPGPPTPSMARPPIPFVPPQPPHHNALMNGAVEQKRLRPAGKGIEDALISRLRIQAHGAQGERPSAAAVLPHPSEMQQSVTINLPATHGRLCLYTKLPDFLQDRQYSLWMLLDKQTLKPTPQPMPDQLPQERAFDVLIHPGVNVVEAHLVAATPRADRVPGGPEVELEIFTVFVNLMRN